MTDSPAALMALKALHARELQKFRASIKPKRPACSYLLFAKEKRIAIRQSLLVQQGLNLSERVVTKELGRRWRELSTQNRLKWQNMYTIKLQKYKVDQKEWRMKRDEVKKLQEKLDTAKNIVQVPLKPSPPYRIYQVSMFHRVQAELAKKRQTSSSSVTSTYVVASSVNVEIAKR